MANQSLHDVRVSLGSFLQPCDHLIRKPDIHSFFFSILQNRAFLQSNGGKASLQLLNRRAGSNGLPDANAENRRCHCEQDNAK